MPVYTVNYRVCIIVESVPYLSQNIANEESVSVPQIILEVAFIAISGPYHDFGNDQTRSVAAVSGRTKASDR